MVVKYLKLTMMNLTLFESLLCIAPKVNRQIIVYRKAREIGLVGLTPIAFFHQGGSVFAKESYQHAVDVMSNSI